MAQERGLLVEFASAGISASDGTTASDGALLVGMERGLALSAHRAQTVSPALVAQASLVLAMGGHHRDRVEALGGTGKTWVLRDFAEGTNAARGVSDPFGGDLATYRTTADELDALIAKVLDRIRAEHFSAAG